MTKDEIKAELIAKNPVLRSGSDETGYQELNEEEYDAVIDKWADGIIAKEEEAAAKLQAAEAKAALLERLGITADEAALLLG